MPETTAGCCDYICPEAIRKNLATEELARTIGREQHIEWIKKLMPKLRRGDRVEVFGENGESQWWKYEPKN